MVDPVEEPPDQLQGDILERQGRPVKQLQEPGPLVELLQGRDRGVVKAGVGLLHHGFQVRRQRAVSHEGPQRISSGETAGQCSGT
jgi:hypothetical protein